MRANGAWNTIAVAYITLTGPYHMRTNTEPLWCYPLLPAASPLGLYWQDITPFPHTTPSILLVQQQPSYTEFSPSTAPDVLAVVLCSLAEISHDGYWLVSKLHAKRCVVSRLLYRAILAWCSIRNSTYSVTLWSSKFMSAAFKNAVRTSQ